MWMQCDAMRLRAHHTALKHILFSVDGKLTSAEVKKVDRHWEGQTKVADSSVQMSASFICLPCMELTLSEKAARRKKDILGLRA